MNPHEQPCQATPAPDLRQQIMDSRVPKNEREWWASREIEKLERELADAKAECEKMKTELGVGVWHSAELSSELARLRAEVERTDAIYQRACEVEHELRAELATERKKVVDEIIANNAPEIAKANTHIADMKARAEKAEAAFASPPLLTGKLTHAGTCYIGEEHVDGVFIAIDREQLKALPRLPMYEQIELRAMKGTPSTL